jgi:hypothetical protein
MTSEDLKSFDKDYDDINSVDKGDLIYYLLYLEDKYNSLLHFQMDFEDDDDYYGD